MSTETHKKPHLEYTIVCEDVRLEMSRNLSLMGVLHVIHAPQFPVTVFKLAVLNHWRGGGRFLSECRILVPDRMMPIASSQPSPLDIPENGGADNITVFTNLTFPTPGSYVVQTLIDSSLFSEKLLHVAQVPQHESVIEAPNDVIN